MEKNDVLSTTITKLEETPELLRTMLGKKKLQEFSWIFEGSDSVD